MRVAPREESDDPREGTVITSRRGAVVVLDRARVEHRCRADRRLPPILAGDRVRWTGTAGEAGLVIEILPRRSVIARRRSDGGTRSIAANVDRVLLVVASSPPYSPPLIDRCLVVAESLSLTASLVLNKLDLLDGKERARIRGELGAYTEIGYETHWVSARTGEGIMRLRNALDRQSSVLIGQSGVGKSSLANLLAPGANARVQELSRRGRAGRHTTTATTAHPLGDEGWLLDSPGVREFAMWSVPAMALAHGFIEFRPYLGRCRFRDCHHDQEPGCAISEAGRTGGITRARLESYRSLVRAAPGPPGPRPI